MALALMVPGMCAASCIRVTVETGEVRAVGTVAHRGRRAVLAEVSLYEPAERLMAYVTSTCMIFEIPPAA